MISCLIQYSRNTLFKPAYPTGIKCAPFAWTTNWNCVPFNWALTNLSVIDWNAVFGRFNTSSPNWNQYHFEKLPSRFCNFYASWMRYDLRKKTSNEKQHRKTPSQILGKKKSYDKPRHRTSIFSTRTTSQNLFCCKITMVQFTVTFQVFFFVTGMLQTWSLMPNLAPAPIITYKSNDNRRGKAVRKYSPVMHLCMSPAHSCSIATTV